MCSLPVGPNGCPLLAQSGHHNCGLGMSALGGKADIHRRRDFYVEMMCEFHRAERTIERDGGAILQVRLHEDYIRTLAGSDLFQRIDRSSSDTLAPMSVRDGEIVDIDLAPLLLKFLQYAYAARPPTTVFSTIATTTMKCSLPSKFVRYSSLGMACWYVSLSLKACPNTRSNSLRSVTSSIVNRR